MHGNGTAVNRVTTATTTRRSAERMTETPRGSRSLRGLLIATDVAAVSIAWTTTNFIHFGASNSNPLTLSRFGFVLLAVLVTTIMIGANKLYRARACSVRALELSTMFRACAVAAAVLTFVADRMRVDGLSIGRIVTGELLAFGFVMIGRSVYRARLRAARAAGRHAWRVVLVGTGDEAFDLHRLLGDNVELGYEVVGVVGDAEEANGRAFTVPYLGEVDDTVSLTRASGATGVIVAPSSVSFAELNTVVRGLLDEGMHVQMSGGLAGFASNRLRANPIGREAAFYLEQVSLTGWQANVKRAIDILLAGLILIPALPVMAVLALFVKLHDRGPVLFRQQRIGRDGAPFMMLKLRTMVVDAEAQLAKLMAHNERTGPLFKLKDDPRFTRLGRFMDATSLNELPQLFNVLRGEMSLVGPRPALAREVESFGDRLLMRHRVRPGITGLWQVEERDSPSFESYERCDVFYVENWSVGLDLAILAQTAGEVLRRSSRRETSSRADDGTRLIDIDATDRTSSADEISSPLTNATRPDAVRVAR